VWLFYLNAFPGESGGSEAFFENLFCAIDWSPNQSII